MIHIKPGDLRQVMFEVGIKKNQMDMILATLDKEYNYEVCDDCNGSGAIVIEDGGYPNERNCPTCSATGKIK